MTTLHYFFSFFRELCSSGVCRKSHFSKIITRRTQRHREKDQQIFYKHLIFIIFLIKHKEYIHIIQVFLPYRRVNPCNPWTLFSSSSLRALASSAWDLFLQTPVPLSVIKFVLHINWNQSPPKGVFCCCSHIRQIGCSALFPLPGRCLNNRSFRHSR